MSKIHPSVYDFGLFQLVKWSQRLLVTTTEPTDYADAVGANLKGVKLLPVVSGPTTHEVTGRKVTVAAFEDGAIHVSGTIAFWALVNDDDSVVLASGALADPKDVLANNAFTMEAFDIAFPGIEA